MRNINIIRLNEFKNVELIQLRIFNNSLRNKKRKKLEMKCKIILLHLTFHRKLFQFHSL
jgi:hypothetical protein